MNRYHSLSLEEDSAILENIAEGLGHGSEGLVPEFPDGSDYELSVALSEAFDATAPQPKEATPPPSKPRTANVSDFASDNGEDAFSSRPKRTPLLLCVFLLSVSVRVGKERRESACVHVCVWVSICVQGTSRLCVNYSEDACVCVYF